MTEKEILQQQEANGQKAFYLMAVGMFYHAYGCGAFALSRATGYRVLRKQRKHGDVLVCGFPVTQLDTVLQRIREAGGEVEQTGEKTFLFRGLDGTADETMVHARADLQSCRSSTWGQVRSLSVGVECLHTNRHIEGGRFSVFLYTRAYI